MTMFRAPLPAGQPRTLRTNAQAKNGTRGFPAGVAYDPMNSVPLDVAKVTPYNDAAQAAPLPTPMNPSNPAAFTPIRRG